MPNINDKAHCKQHAVLMGQDRHQRISRVCRQDLTGSKHCRDACIADLSVEAAIKEDGGGLQAAMRCAEGSGAASKAIERGVS